MKQESIFKAQNDKAIKRKYIRANTYNFLLQQKKINDREVLQREHLILLAMLYGQFIEEGRKSIKDYKQLTMRELESEIKIRILMLRGERLRLVKKDKELRERQEREFLERLKRNK